MTHGDLIPGNVLTRDGRLAGLLDTGGFGPADPALDTIAAWHLCDGGPRAAFREALACDDLKWQRSRAWAFEQALGAAWYYRNTNPAMFTMGMTTLGRLLRDKAQEHQVTGASRGKVPPPTTTVLVRRGTVTLVSRA